MPSFARKALIFVCVLSLGCQHWSPQEEVDIDDPGVPTDVMKPIDIVDIEDPSDPPAEATPECVDFDEDLGLCQDEDAPKPPTEVVEIDPNTNELPPVEEKPEEIPAELPSVASIEEKNELEQTLTETPVPVSDPVADDRATPEPITPGSFKKLARACDVLSDPSESGAVMNPLTAGRKLWTEEVDGRFVKVYRSVGVGYLSVECFREPPVVVSEFTPQVEEKVPEKKDGPIVTKAVEMPSEPASNPEPAPAPEVAPPPAPVAEEKPEAATMATVEQTLPPERPLPPPAVTGVPESESEPVSPLALGGGAGLFLFALFYWLTGRRQRRVFESTGSRTLTAL